MAQINRSGEIERSPARRAPAPSRGGSPSSGGGCMVVLLVVTSGVGLALAALF